ncbi:MAG: LamG-like jellyroll fold domain-containing protein [Acidimicrobiales bacterium]
MQQGNAKRTSARIRQGLIAATMLVWLAAIVVYSLWSDRPQLDINHELELGISVLALATGAASLLLIGRRRLQLGSGIVVCLVGFGFILELAQGYFVDSHRTEAGDFVIIAISAVAGVSAVAVLAAAVGSIWTQRIVAALLVAGATGTLVVPGLQTPEFQHWWACERPGHERPSGPALTISVAGGDLVTSMNGHAASAITSGAVIDQQASSMAFTGDGTIAIVDTKALICRLASTRSFSLRVEARTTDLAQGGPARLFTVSDGTEYNEIYLQLGQQGDALSVRLRTAPGWYEELSVPLIFTDTDWHTLDVVFDNGMLTAYRDGASVGQQPTDRRQLDGWDQNLPVTLGNEATGDRAFSGEIREVWLETDTNAAID